MKKPAGIRLLRLLWLLALALLVAVWLFPVSNLLTRSSGVGLCLIVWFGLVGLCWQRRTVRHLLIGCTVLLAGLSALPARPLPSTNSLRDDYVAGLRRYDGVTYYWGGESPKGIDCSGLVRRGLIDSLFWRGVRIGDPGLIRRSISLWWNDTTARALGEQHTGQTVHVLNASSINSLDHTQLLPGDLAVTRNGLHIMAYLGNNVWIEADPTAGRVIQVTVPAPDNGWFQMPVSIMRWNIFQ